MSKSYRPGRSCVAEPLESRTLFAVPSGFSETLVASGLSSPTTMAVAPDGRVFIGEQGGRVRVVKGGKLLSTPFTSLPAVSNGERGLTGIAFDPSFSSNGYVYLYWTENGSPAPHQTVSRVTASSSNRDVAVSSSRRDLLELPAIGSAYHLGGPIQFGPDGKLYVAVGETNNPPYAQSLNSPFGKVLRINRDGSIPTDNPFYSQTSGKNRAIWARGLRNPYALAFQPGTGRMFINDVGPGQLEPPTNTWEEINAGSRGANYGWPIIRGGKANGRATPSGYRDPLYTYVQGVNQVNGAAITGGTFYNPRTGNFPSSYVGKYFFTDFRGGWVKMLNPSTGAVTGTFATGLSAPVDLDVSSDGSMYYLQRGGASEPAGLYRIRYTNSRAPVIGTQPASRTVSVGQRVTFSVSASGATPLSYQWQRNGVNIAGATSSSYSISSATTSLSGSSYRVIVSNSAGRVTSNSARLTVTSNRAPTAAITSPAYGTVYRGGQVISFSGSANDPETGSLPSSAFTWEVVFHHNDHTHPFMPPRTGIKSGTFTIPRTGETSANVFYRIRLRVKDPAGLTHEVTRDVKPLVVDLRLATNIAGLSVTLDGSSFRTPFSTRAVAGMTRTIGAPASQVLNGVTYDFLSWSDGRERYHSITTPGASTTYTAVYRRRG